VEDRAFVAKTMAALERPEASSRPWQKYAVAAGLILLLAPLALFYLRQDGRQGQGTFQARGARIEDRKLAGTEIVIVDRDHSQPLSKKGDVLSKTAGLSFRVTNATKGPLYWMALAIDSRGEVHWFFPEYRDPKSNPKAIQVLAGERERLLSDVVRPEDVAPGLLRVIAFLSKQQHTVREIEARLKGLPAKVSPASRFAGAWVQEWSVGMEVK
jgi:hypothetical protein